MIEHIPNTLHTYKENHHKFYQLLLFASKRTYIRKEGKRKEIELQIDKDTKLLIKILPQRKARSLNPGQV